VLRAAPLGDGVARVAVAVLGLAGLARWERWAAARFPVQFGFDPSLPPSLEHILPGFTVFWSAARGSFLAAAIAATVALAAGTDVFRRPAGRLLGLGLVLVACAPTTMRSFGESMAAFVPTLLTLAWITVAAFWLLRDHAGAWLLFGAAAFGGPAVADLLLQPASADRAAGWQALFLIVLAAVLLLSGRRRQLTAES
ncbi:MAG TPA: hypothetical protein VLO07_07850, partial [Thermoanaerobaculia bacterium]|nr:hypothetical protein [Thermoanaerobaculia bacterium]